MSYLHPSLPYRVMHELASTSRMKAPGAPNSAFTANVKPLTRVRLDLRPDSADEGEVNGRLTVAVGGVGGCGESGWLARFLL